MLMASSCFSRHSSALFPGWLLAMLFAGAINSTYGSETHTDPEGLVTFRIPDAWVLQSDSHGMRFRRSDSNERTVLSVTPRMGRGEENLEQLRSTRLSQVRSQSREVATDTVSSLNGFTVWEFVVRPGADGRGAISHSLHLLSPDLHIQIMLIAEPDRYAGYVADLRAVADSVQTGAGAPRIRPAN